MDDNRSIPEGFTPVWNDDFEGDSISFIEWNQEIHEPGTFFNELQAYIASEKTVSVKDGILYICPVKEHDKDGSIKYFSGKVSTQGKHEIQYGRFEARIRVPRGKGLRPFFSISSGTSKHGRWPRFSEIDIMEYNTNEPLNLYGSVHSQSTESDDNHILQQGIYEIRPEEDPSMSFHTYACDWEPGTIRLYFDGTEYFSCSVQEGFDHPFYVSFGVGIGGDWPGNPDKNTVFGIENAMQIEYLRIYRRPEYKVKEEGKRRKLIGVCGVWEDAENFNMFIRSLQTPDIIRDYVTAVFTFSLAANIEEDVEAEIKFAQLVDKAGLSGIVIFGEMIKSERIISLLISNAHRRNIPVIMFEHTMPGCINLEFDYKGGFEKVVRHVIEDHGLKTVDMFAGFRGNEVCIDTYCGTGSTTLTFAGFVGSITGVEIKESAYKDALKNAAINKVNNASFVLADATQYMEEAAKNGAKVDCVILDPTRAGTTSRFIKACGKLKPDKIIYISCCPETLARDLKIFRGQGYEARVAKPVDMFPWTEKIETVVCLTR